ncbi:MAG: hypothetical protein AB7F86_16970 [Bdellovibrionales bacterium]
MATIQHGTSLAIDTYEGVTSGTDELEVCVSKFSIYVLIVLSIAVPFLAEAQTFLGARIPNSPGFGRYIGPMAARGWARFNRLAELSRESEMKIQRIQETAQKARRTPHEQERQQIKEEQGKIEAAKREMQEIYKALSEA